jgi:RNA polymerase sigma-70 factor (ECF subfamily)
VRAKEQWHEDGESTLSTPILVRVAAGDLTAVQSCMNRYGGLVWSLARRLSRSPSDAEDAVQEIFLDLWKSADRFDPALSSESAFIVMIARRRLIDRHRKSRRAPTTTELGGTELEQLGSQESGPEMGGEVHLAQKALGQLRPEQRQVLLMATCDGMSHEQISEATGLALGTVKTHARRGLLKVREILSIRTSTGADEADLSKDGT